jgi:adenylate cyclase
MSVSRWIRRTSAAYPPASRRRVSPTCTFCPVDPDRLSKDEVAGRVGTTPERIDELVALGIIRPETDGSFGRPDVLRARVVLDLSARGIDLPALGAALASGDLSLGYLESAGRRHPRSERTFAKMCDETGTSFETIERLYVAFGLPHPHPDELVPEDDVRVFRLIPILFGAGVGEDDILRIARVWGDSIRRVAQFQSHYLHAVIEEPFRRRGLGDNEAFEAAIREVALRAGRSGEQLLGWLLRRHSDTFFVEHQYAHVEAALEAAGVRPRPERGAEAAVFADLTGYTHLTEESGDEVAAGVSLSLARLVSEVAARHRGEVVKMLGDGVHFHFADPGDAIRASLDIVRDVGPRGLPPAHIGVNAGRMIYDEGDYFGRTVNIAARIASAAERDQVFVGEDAIRVVEPDGFRLVQVGELSLKGIARPVRVSQAIAD